MFHLNLSSTSNSSGRESSSMNLLVRWKRRLQIKAWLCSFPSSCYGAGFKGPRLGPGPTFRMSMTCHFLHLLLPYFTVLRTLARWSHAISSHMYGNACILLSCHMAGNDCCCFRFVRCRSMLQTQRKSHPDTYLQR